jgi:hypothetical protein
LGIASVFSYSVSFAAEKLSCPKGRCSAVFQLWQLAFFNEAHAFRCVWRRRFCSKQSILPMVQNLKSLESSGSNMPATFYLWLKRVTRW